MPDIFDEIEVSKPKKGDIFDEIEDVVIRPPETLPAFGPSPLGLMGRFVPAVRSMDQPETSTAQGLVGSAQKGIERGAMIPEIAQAIATKPAFSTETRPATLGLTAHFLPAVRGLLQAQQSNIPWFKETVKDIAEQQKKIADIPQSPAQMELGRAATQSEKWGAWLKNPVELTTSIALESLPPSLAGAGVGVAGGPAGMAAGVGLASGLTEFSSTFLDEASKRGYNVQNADSLEKFLNDDEAYNAAIDRGIARAGIVGGVDAITAGTAGSFLKPALALGLKQRVIATGKELSAQALGGAGGEAAAQLATGQPLDIFDVAMEAIAEIGSGPVEVAGNIREALTERTQDAVQQKTEGTILPVQQPEVAQEGAGKVPAAESGKTAAEALTNVDDVLRARGYRDFHIQKMSESEKQAEAAKPIPTAEADAIRFWQMEDAIKAEKDINKKMAMLQNVFMERELIKNRNPKNEGGVPERPTPATPVEETKETTEPVSVGPGAASPEELAPPVPFTTSNKNRIVDEERKTRGLPPMMGVARQGNQAAWDDAMRQIDENPQVQDELITELTAQPRALTATENSLLLHRRVDLRNEYEKALYRWREAFEGNDMVRAAEESRRVRDWGSKLSDLEDITKRTGAESGRSLQARKMMANEDYSLAAMELRAMEAKGRNLTQQEHIDLIKAQQRIQELENRLLELEETRETREVETSTTEAMSEVSREAPKEAKSKDFDLDREEQLLGGIKAKVDKGQLNDITSLVQQLARVFWRRGIRGREPMIDTLHDTLKIIIPTFTRDDTKRAFSGYGNFKPLSKEEIDVGLRDLRGQTQQVLKLEALEARKPLEKTGQERRVPTDEERRLIKQVNELKRKYGVVVTDPATQLKSALAARKTYYEHRIADLKHEIETRQRIVKTKTASPTDPELQALIAEVERLKAEHEQIFTKPEMTDEQRLKLAIAAAERNQAHWEVRLNNAEKGIFDKRTPGRKVTSPELELIQAETAAIREHVKELHDLSDAVIAQKRETSILAQKATLEKQIAEQERKLREGDLSSPGQAMNRPADPELEELKQKRDALNKQLADMRKAAKPVKSKEEIALQSLKTRMKTETARLRERIAKKDFSKKAKKPPAKLDEEGIKLKAELDLAKEEFNTKMEQDRWARMSVFQKTKRKIADVYDAARALMTTGELSFILRQGKLAALSHPIKTAKALPDMFRALLASEQRAREIDMQTHNDPDAEAARASKLYLVEEGVSLHKQEEILMGRWVGKIPIVKNFNRAAQVFLNRIRLDLWKAMRKSLSKSGTPTPEEDRQIAMFVNEATGRGGLWKFEPAAVPLARIMFSPRYYASRLQLAAGHSLWGGTMRTRRIIATEYARSLVGLGLYYTLLASMFGSDDDEKKGKIETDPRSADFGKVRFGNTRLDPLAGLSQVIVLGSRSVTGEKKTLKGEVQPIRGDKVKFGGDKWSDIVARHLRGKLHPVPGAIANLFDGTDLGGDESTLINQTQNMVAPITYMDIYAALKEQDLDDATALALLALLGEGLQTYEPRK